MDVLELYRIATERVPAYRRFLGERLGAVPAVATLEDFSVLPFMDKESYIKRYALEEICLDGTLRGKHVLCRSSGTSGKATYWPQLPEQERYVADYLLSDLEESFAVSVNPALVIVALGLGSWISGELTTWGLRNLGVQGGNITLVSPGLNMEETVEILETFSPRFAQTVIYTYPPFAKTLLDLAEQKGIPLKELRIAFRLAGEGYSEIFRSTLNRRMGRNEGDLSSVLSGYGATDFGSAGKETPLCAAIKRLLFENDLAEAVLGRREIPSLCQYDPESHFLETDQEELVVSRYQAVPLVRYRTGDRGVLLGYDDLLGRLAAAGADPLALLEHRGISHETVRPLPFVLVWGRIDGGVTFFGANILVSQVKEVFESHPELARLFTGDFSLRKTEDDRLDPVLEILVEPRRGIDPDLGTAARLVARGLEERSTEFATVRKTQGDKALPRLVRAPSGFFAGHHKIRYVS